MRTSRRSRMHRTRTGKHLMLTERDLTIFRWLSRYCYLRSTYLHAFARGASAKRFIERLGNLFHEGYLDRPEAQWRFADCRYVPAVYELGKGGREALAATENPGDERRVLLGQGAHRQFAHSLMICEVLASVELATMGMPDLRFIPLPEILAKAPESARGTSFPLRIPLGAGNGSHIVPDAIFGLEYRSRDRRFYRFFALEADRGTMPVVRTQSASTSYLTKLFAYERAISGKTYRAQLGVPNLIVLTVTTSAARQDAMLDAIAQAPGDFSPFFFAAAPALTEPDLDLIHRPWNRSKGDPIAIDCAHTK